MEERAVVLLNGGVDSTTTLATAKSEGVAVHALSFRYGRGLLRRSRTIPVGPRGIVRGDSWKLWFETDY